MIQTLVQLAPLIKGMLARRDSVSGGAIWCIAKTCYDICHSTFFLLPNPKPYLMTSTHYPHHYCDDDLMTQRCNARLVKPTMTMRAMQQWKDKHDNDEGEWREAHKEGRNDTHPQP